MGTQVANVKYGKRIRLWALAAAAIILLYPMCRLLAERAIRPARNEYYYFTEGARYEWEGKYELAARSYGAAIGRSPENAFYLAALGELQTKMGNYSSALESYTEAVNLLPGDAQYLQRRAEIYALIEDYDHALEDYNRLIKANQGERSHYRALGDICLAMEEYDKALENYLIFAAAGDLEDLWDVHYMVLWDLLYPLSYEGKYDSAQLWRYCQLWGKFLMDQEKYEMAVEFYQIIQGDLLYYWEFEDPDVYYTIEEEVMMAMEKIFSAM